jgi:hypothetical protein
MLPVVLGSQPAHRRSRYKRRQMQRECFWKESSIVNFRKKTQAVEEQLCRFLDEFVYSAEREWAEQ